MYQVYVSFIISIITNRFFWQGVGFGGAGALFGRLVHVSSVANNVLETPVGQIPGYTAYVFEHALLSGEVITVLTTLVLIGLGISAARVIARTLIAPTSYRTI